MVNSQAGAVLLEAERLGVQVRPGAEAGMLRVKLPDIQATLQQKRDIVALVHQLKAFKAELLTVLQAHPPRNDARLMSVIDVQGHITHVDLGAEVVAVKAWSNVLQEAVWVVADGEPMDDYLSDGRVITHREVRVLLDQGDGIKVWSDLSPTESAA